MSVLSNLIYRFNAIPIKIPASYFVGINKVIPKLLWKGKRHRIANTILKWDKVRELTTSRLTIVIKRAWYWQKNRQIDQWKK